MGTLTVCNTIKHCSTIICIIPYFCSNTIFNGKTHYTWLSGGPITTDTLDRLTDEFVEAISRHGELDAAYLCLHGAMAGETENDPEGRLLERLREVVGDIPIVVSLDLHAIITDRLVRHATALTPYHTYPHTDQYETGERAAKLLLRLMANEVSPTTARVELPMLVRGDELLTATGMFGEAIRMCQEIESSPNGLAAGVIIGNAFTDVPDLQSNVLVTLDGDEAAAEEHAWRIARFMWERRRSFVAQLTPLDESIRLAAATDGLTVLSDAADATASGASGDSNAILRAMIEQQFAKRALVPIVDGPAVAAAQAAGVGATVTVQLGGVRDPDRFTPLQATAEVVALHDGDFRYEDGTIGRAGGTAVLRIGSITLLVTTESVYVVGRAVFMSHGLDPRDFDAVVVKSPNGFRTHYESIAARVVPVDAPGSTSANLLSLPFSNCRRPVFPLDDNFPVDPRLEQHST